MNLGCGGWMVDGWAVIIAHYSFWNIPGGDGASEGGTRGWMGSVF